MVAAGQPNHESLLLPNPAFVRAVGSKRYHTDWIKSFLTYAAYGEAPIVSLMWTGVSTIAGALRRRVWIDMRYFQWLANFYVIIVAPPGVVSKSTTANIGMNLLREVNGIKFGPDVVTWQALVQAFSESSEEVPDPASGEFHAMSCLTIASDELGNFLNPQDREMVDMMVTLWDGKKGTLKKLTKLDGEQSIVNPWLNFIGCTTPAWVAGNFPEYMIGGGFTSRCVFVYIDTKRQEVAYPDEAIPNNAEFFDLRQTLIHDLEAIASIFGEFEISTDARAWGREWYSHHWRHPPEGLSNEQFSGYLARKQTHIHKLAMVIAVSQGTDLVISREHLVHAEGVVSTLEPSMNKVFARIGQNDVTRGMSNLVELVHKRRSLPYNELYTRMFRTMSLNDFEVAFRSAISAGHIETFNASGEIIVKAKGNGI